jgi:hypothetical protein
MHFVKQFQEMQVVRLYGHSRWQSGMMLDYLDQRALSGKYMDVLQPWLAEYAHCSCRQRILQRLLELPNTRPMTPIL